MSYFWFQQTGGEDPWQEALSSHRSKIIQENRPTFVTVLDAFSVPDHSWGRDDYAGMKYSGPLYFDWDAANVMDTLPHVSMFLQTLKDMGVNLNSLRLYATGGRGFHLEIPQQVFMPKIPKGGVIALPYIYREMAMELVVDTLDMRVYTGRKGRMWRTPGIQRDNGRFKVPIKVSDLEDLNVDLYSHLCRQETEEPARADPELCVTLAALFAKAQDKVQAAVKRRSKGNTDEVLLARFKGLFPPSVERIMRGEGLLPGVGFQKVSMQLAITANALGRTADELVEMSKELCQKHEGDSSRYNSPRKREEELRRMWEYTHDNPCYSYSKGGIRSLIDVDITTGDLDGLAPNAGIGTVADESDSPNTPEQAAELSVAGNALVEGMLITRSGIHKRTAEGMKTVSNLGFGKPKVLRDINDHEVLGIEADFFCDNKPVGRRLVTQKELQTRASLSAVCATYGGIFSGSDNQAGVVGLLLRRAAEKRGQVSYAVHKEGLDIVQDPLVSDRIKQDVIWTHPDVVLTDNEDAGYTYRGDYNPVAVFRADVHNATAMESNPDTLEWTRAMLGMNSPSVVAQVLGWFVSTFHKQFYQQAFNQFPILHPYGPAGNGKSMTTMLISRLNYFTVKPALRSAGPATSTFVLKQMMSGSASVPLLLDEYKVADMGTSRRDFLLQMFRLAYNQGMGSSGGIARGTATSSWRDATNFTLSTPMAFMAEAQETQTAIVQRTIPVYFDAGEARKHTSNYQRAERGSQNMSGLGRIILKHSFRETVEQRRETLQPIIDTLRSAMPKSIHDRQVYNTAVVYAGLNYLDDILDTLFDGALKGDMERLKASLTEHSEDLVIATMSEASKVMNDISLISRMENAESEFAIREGHEFIVKDGYLELLMREVFVKYFSWCKRKGMEPYYMSSDSFVGSMKKFSAVTDKVCRMSPLRKSGQSVIFRFSLEQLQAEGIEEFKTKAGL